MKNATFSVLWTPGLKDLTAEIRRLKTLHPEYTVAAYRLDRRHQPDDKNYVVIAHNQNELQVVVHKEHNPDAFSEWKLYVPHGNNPKFVSVSENVKITA